MFFFPFHNTLYGNRERELEVRRRFLSHSAIVHQRASAASPIRSGIPLLRGTSSEGDSVRGSPCDTPARLRTGLQRPISSDPGIRVPLHPLRLRCLPSPYRSGYASVRRLAGSGASTLSMHGLFRNGPLDAGLTPRPPPAAAPPCTGDPRRSGGFHVAHARDLRPLAALPLDAFRRGHSWWAGTLLSRIPERNQECPR